MSSFFKSFFGGETSAQATERRKLRADQAVLDTANKKRKKKLDEEALVAQSRAQKKIRAGSARRSVITSPLGIVEDTLA